MNVNTPLTTFIRMSASAGIHRFWRRKSRPPMALIGFIRKSGIVNGSLPSMLSTISESSSGVKKPMMTIMMVAMSAQRKCVQFCPMRESIAPNGVCFFFGFVVVRCVGNHSFQERQSG